MYIPDLPLSDDNISLRERDRSAAAPWQTQGQEKTPCCADQRGLCSSTVSPYFHMSRRSYTLDFGQDFVVVVGYDDAMSEVLKIGEASVQDSVTNGLARAHKSGDRHSVNVEL